MLRLLSFVSFASLLMTVSFAEEAKPAAKAEEAKPAAKKVDVGTQAPSSRSRTPMEKRSIWPN